MSARFEFTFSSSSTEAHPGDLQAVRQTDFPYSVMDGPNMDCEPRREKPDVKQSLPPATQPYTYL